MQKENLETDDIIEEGAEYSAKSDFNKPKLIEEAFKKCFELRAKEMHSGYTNTSQSSDGTILKQRVEDTRQAFCNSVMALRCLLSPEINRNNKIKKMIEEFDEEETRLWNLYTYKEPLNPTNQDNLKIKFSGRKFMPENDDILKTLNYSYNKGVLIESKGVWNANVNAYWNLMVEVKDAVLSELSNLVDELNYFKQETNY